MNFYCENCGWSEIISDKIMCNYNGLRTWHDGCCEAWKPKEIDKTPTVGETTRPVFNGRFWECEECRQRYKDILVVKEYKHCPGCGRKIERWY